MEPTKKKTPKDTTEFEREQLRFFLSREDVAATLAELNPSLAWLPELARMKLIQSANQLTPWIEKNFDDPEAVREVSGNLDFFDERAADLLEFRLNRRRETLPPLLAKSWQLVIRHIRGNPRGVLRNEWFDIQPRIKSGEHSAELFERLARVLRPKPKVSKRISLYDDGSGEHVPQRPSDLLTVEYEVDDDIIEAEVLAAWPKDAPAEVEQKLLIAVADALDIALADAIEIEVESNFGYGISDNDVPSVAAHRQNEFRSGFLPIVRIIAETWTHLAQKDASLALPFVQRWSSSPLKLNKRLALFAAAEKAVRADDAANVLLTLPQGLLFLTNASVEVFRLIRERWKELPAGKRIKIEDRIAAGPPPDWFRSDADSHVERARFNVLGEMERAGLELGPAARAALTEIKSKYPKWELRPSEQAGFHIWHEGGDVIVGNPEKLQTVPVESLVDVAKMLAEKADFMAGDDWQALCQSDPQHALGGLEAKAKKGEWPDWAWNPFLWAAQKLDSLESTSLTGELLLTLPDRDFSNIASSASWWLNEKAKALDDNLLWPLWNKIEAATALELADVQLRDALVDALNSPAGRLAEVLIKRITRGESSGEMPPAMRRRFDMLASAPGAFGKLARIRFAAEVSLLFERAPIWTVERIVPLFDWSSPDAVNVWSARKYSNYIGSPQLFELTKASFLELFGRSEIAEDDLRVYGEWLAVIMIANRARNAGYPISATEARSALRAAGVRALSSVGHRLALEMEGAKSDEKIAHWENVVGPVFESIWPLDADLQSPSLTFKLVQILRASGDAFPRAAEIIVPFIRPEDPHRHTSVHSISTAVDVLYASSPEKMLDLIAAVVGDTPTRSAYGLTKVLDRIREHAPLLANTRKFQRLVSLANAY